MEVAGACLRSQSELVAEQVSSHPGAPYGPQGHRGTMKSLNLESQLAWATMSLQIPGHKIVPFLTNRKLMFMELINNYSDGRESPPVCRK